MRGGSPPGLAMPFQSLLGAGLDELPPAVQRLHAAPEMTASGSCEVIRGSGWASRLIAALVRLPPAASTVPLRFHRHCTEAAETWTRQFGAARMQSRLSARGGLLHERLGLATLRFRLQATAQSLEWQPVSLALLGLPLPVHRLLRIRAIEFERDGRYGFEVRAEVWGVGLIVHYRGWLEV